MYFGRTELDNFDVDNAWDIIDLFEQKIANFCGSPYAVSVDNCTNALFLCLKYIDKPQTITILTDNKDAYEWFRRARYCGRIDGLPYDKHEEFTQRGWNMYMTPEDAARGLLLFFELFKKSKNFEDMGGSESYSDLSKSKIFTD
jgi:hypothetical protein